MIEIEKKFILSDEQKAALIKDAEFSGEKHIVDSYFDTDDFRLTLADIWFRARGGSFELKEPLHRGGSAKSNQYYEHTDHKKIGEVLGFEETASLETAMEEQGIHSFVTCHTTRKSYRKDGFTIDIDTVTYDDSSFTYSLAEVELLIEDASQASVAEAQILEFAESHGLSTDKSIDGKIIAFLKVERPRHYALLVEALFLDV